MALACVGLRTDFYPFFFLLLLFHSLCCSFSRIRLFCFFGSIFFLFKSSQILFTTCTSGDSAMCLKCERSFIYRMKILCRLMLSIFSFAHLAAPIWLSFYTACNAFALTVHTQFIEFGVDFFFVLNITYICVMIADSVREYHLSFGVFFSIHYLRIQ